MASFFSHRCWQLACCVGLLCAAVMARADIAINLDNDQSRLEVKAIVIATGGEGELKANRLRDLTRLASSERRKYPATISIDELHRIADVLTVAVRAEGYTFDSLYLPPQTVANGIVQFRYQKSVLVSINVINNTDYDDRRLSKPFAPVVGERVFAPRIENIVYALQAQPTLSVFAFYSRGPRQGEVVLNLRVDERSQPFYSLRAENYGSQATGKYRMVGELKGYSLLGDFDRATLAVLSTQGEGTTTYGYLNYRYTLPSLNTWWELGVGDTRYALGSNFEQLEATGSSRSLRLDVNRALNHNPKHSRQIGLGGFHKTSSFGSDDALFDDALGREETSMGAAVNYSANHTFGKGRIAFGASAIGGEFSLDEGEGQTLAKLEYHFFASTQFNSSSRFAIQPRLFIRGQLADKTPLPAIETLSLSGFYGVRASPVGTVSADTGVLLSAELHMPALVNTQLAEQPFSAAPYMFFDSGSGEQYQADDASALSVSQSGFGAGLNLRWGRFSANATYASATNQEVNGDDQVYVQLRWQ
ncbi:ShlB/FhaC/HecB family hemolysin secretion/activation protein [Saccharophagus degradans]|nr:ShlB/FhaC/HecB family hemolysin secretion/activation protein [Saccharophagus degradans]